MDSIDQFIIEEEDVLYLRGEDKGQQKAEARFVRNLLTKMGLTTEQVADVVGVSVAFVEDVRQKMVANP